MKNKSVINQLGQIAIAGVLTSISLLANAGAGGHGGDVVRCQPIGNSPYRGHYFLDYLLTAGNPAMPLNQHFASVTESIGAIINHLNETQPTLGGSLNDFYKSYKVADYTAHYTWEKSPTNLVYLQDQNLMQQLPKNCTGNIYQAIIRNQMPSGNVVFQYDEPLLAKARKNGALQESMALVHEWLRDQREDAALIRRVNAYLHSELFMRAGAETVAKTLSQMGFSATGTPNQIEADRKYEERIGVAMKKCAGPANDPTTLEGYAELNGLLTETITSSDRMVIRAILLNDCTR